MASRTIDGDVQTPRAARHRVRYWVVATLLAVLASGCATSPEGKKFSNAGYDEANYDLSLCWKQFVYRRATDGRPLANEKYTVRDLRGSVVGSGRTSAKGKTVPARCDPRGALSSELVFD